MAGRVSKLRSRIMSQVRSVDTGPELALAAALKAAGARSFRRNVRGLPGTPDVVFARAKLAVFCDGDFWHGRHWERRLAAGPFKTRKAYWTAKIERNMARDRRVNRRLWSLGWTVRRLWGTDVLRSPAAAAARVMRALEKSENARAAAKRRTKAKSAKAKIGPRKPRTAKTGPLKTGPSKSGRATARPTSVLSDAQRRDDARATVARKRPRA